MATGFPNLQPALTFTLVLDQKPMEVGSLSRGASLTVVPIMTGTLRSEPGFHPEIDATLLHGTDSVSIDPDNKHIRPSVHSAWKTKDGSFFSLTYNGNIELTAENVTALQDPENAKSTPHGTIFMNFNFETGSEALKPLENGVFVASGRFVVEKGKPTGVEYKISKVVGGA